MPGEQIIAQRYRLEERIGAGGMGEVWRATDTKLGRRVALKRPHEDGEGQVRREARIAAGLHHPNVVTVFDTEVHDGTKWLVMEYLTARSLAEIIRADGPMAPEVAAAVGAQVAAALAAMHERDMVHRDVTPGNVLVSQDHVAKLPDFGIAHWDEVTVTGEGRVLGTPAYMAPEVAAGRDARRPADVFSLGATLYAAVEGHSPWGQPGENPESLRRRARSAEQQPAIRAGALGPVLAELLRTDPAARPTAADAKRMLEDVYGGTVPLVPLPPAPGTGATTSRRRKVMLPIGGGVVAVALTAGTIAYVNRDTGGQEHPSPSAAAGAVLDIATADPCALLDRSSLNGFGTSAVQLDSEYGEFNRCGLTVPLTAPGADIAAVGLYIERIPEYAAAGHPLGTLGPIQKPAEDDGRCERLIPLTDGNQVRISAHNHGARKAEPCDLAEAVANRTFEILEEGPIPRRRAPFPDGSLANVDACGLLTTTEVADIAGARPEAPDPELGNWRCYWEMDTRQVTVSFTREWNEPPDDDDMPIPVLTRTAYQDVDDLACSIEINGREYRVPNEIQTEWVEVATVTLDTDEDSGESGASLCDRAELLAVAVAKRLPPI